MVKPSFKSLTGRSRTVCVGCGYSGVRFGDVAGQDTRQWVKVNHESGLGLCSGCDAFLCRNASVVSGMTRFFMLYFRQKRKAEEAA